MAESSGTSNAGSSQGAGSTPGYSTTGGYGRSGPGYDRSSGGYSPNAAGYHRGAYLNAPQGYAHNQHGYSGMTNGGPSLAGFHGGQGVYQIGGSITANIGDGSIVCFYPSASPINLGYDGDKGSQNSAQDRLSGMLGSIGNPHYRSGQNLNGGQDAFTRALIQQALHPSLAKYGARPATYSSRPGGQPEQQEFYKQGQLEHRCPTCGGFSLFGAECDRCKIKTH